MLRLKSQLSSSPDCNRIHPSARRRTITKEWQSQAHVKWECLYHVVIAPRYRRKVFFRKRRKEIGEMLRHLCRQKGIGLVEGNAMSDHIHTVQASSRSVA
ncbi:IS200/IS605 family transposase [Candidatus Hydrogenedentota bacterium]